MISSEQKIDSHLFGKIDKLHSEMSWRMDWCLLATGLISLGLTMVQKGRADLLQLLAEDSGGVNGILMGASGLIVPLGLLGAFVGRFFWRIVTRTWR